MNSLLAQLAAVCLLWMLAILPPVLAEPGKRLPSVPQSDLEFRVAYTSGLFTGMNKNDAVAAIQTWVESVARSRDVHVRAKIKIFDDLEDLDQTLAKNEIDILTIHTAEYLSLQSTNSLTPVAVPLTHERPDHEYVLLVRRDTQIRGIGELKGKELMLQVGNRVHLSRLWLNQLLAGADSNPLPVALDSVEEVNKASAAVLPVFFGKKDACVVDRPGFETLVELNPQLQQQLKTIAMSQPILEALVCLRTDYWDYERTSNDLLELHKKPAGQQILIVFRIDRLAPFQLTYLASTRNLLNSPG